MKWGGLQGTDCDPWHFVQTPDLSIIEEFVAPGASESHHAHRHARRFFYVLEGELTLGVEHHQFVLHARKGIEISPGQQHQALNRGVHPVRMIVTSQLPGRGDRVAA
jgi:mannose-6-phosphate isomerase-like protein (cupin superfamily)